LASGPVNLTLGFLGMDDRYQLGLLVILGAAALAVLGGPMVLLYSEARTRRRRLADLYAGREPLDAQAFYERYFSSQGAPVYVVDTIRRILAEELGIDVSRLKDTDDFGGNLAFLWEGDGYDSVEVVLRMEEAFGIVLSDEEAARMRTIRDMVAVVVSKVAQREA
jgi:acyl carrier protein